MTCSVKLVSISTPVIEGANLSPEEFIAYTARVSNPGNQMNTETAPKLLKYLLENKHYSPFEMVDFVVEITTSMAIGEQILRHSSAKFQKFSMRYAKANAFITYPARRQDTKNRQNSIDDLPQDVKDWFMKSQQEVWDLAFTRYTQAIQQGIAKEQARFFLPMNTQTTLYMKMNVRDWLFYLLLRSGNGTQKEHMDIANAIIQEVMIPKFPVVSEVVGWSSAR